MSKMISIAKDFSRSPAGRFKTDGPYSGEAFRDGFLWPALTENEGVEVDLDGALGFGSSFLEEAFGGLVRKYGISSKELHEKLKIKSRLKIYEQRIWRYVDDARRS